MTRVPKRGGVSFGVSGICQGGPPVPGGPAADLVFIQAGQALGSLEVLFRRPPDSSDLDRGGQRDVAGTVAAVERQLAGAPAAAGQQPGGGRLAGGGGPPGPVVGGG